MEKVSGRAPSGQALAVPVEPASGLAPMGFDPSRVVTVTAADWNGDSFDGSPFDPAPAPEWLMQAIRAGHIKGDCPGSTDYAVWWVWTPYGKVLAEPGDKIVQHHNGDLGVIRWTRDSDGSPNDGDAKQGSVEDDSAAIAQTPSGDPS